MGKFWIVARRGQHASNPLEHESFEIAQSEAIRLSEKFPKECFYVYECVGRARTELPTTWTPAK